MSQATSGHEAVCSLHVRTNVNQIPPNHQVGYIDKHLARHRVQTYILNVRTGTLHGLVEMVLRF